MGGKPWTKDEEIFLKKNNLKLGYKKIATALNKSYKAVRRKSEMMGLAVGYKKRMQHKMRHSGNKEYSDDPINYFVAGFVAGEGTFTKKRSPHIYTFAVAVAIDDINMLKIIKKTIGVGRIYTQPKRKKHWKDVAVYSICNQIQIYTNLIPFMDKFLIHSRKKNQFLEWKIKFVEKWLKGVVA